MHSKECQDTIFFIGRVITFLQSGNIYHCLLLSDSTRVSYRMFTEWLIEVSLSQDVPQDI